MAARKSDDEDQHERKGRETGAADEHAAARATGAQLGPRTVAGTVLGDDGRVTYTLRGAVSALPGGPKDPTIQPGQFEADAGDVKLLDRADAGPLTGDAARDEKK